MLFWISLNKLTSLENSSKIYTILKTIKIVGKKKEKKKEANCDIFSREKGHTEQVKCFYFKMSYLRKCY